MTKSLFLIFSHKFTPDQEADAAASLGINRIVALPQDLQEVWSSIPPEADKIMTTLAPIRSWLSYEGFRGDYVLVQGDFGACYLMAQFVLELGLVPVYSTTERRAVDEVQPDGSVTVTHSFQHVRFRKYGE
jgi:hypothetical protein